jgi:hypothetical protein
MRPALAGLLLAMTLLGSSIQVAGAQQEVIVAEATAAFRSAITYWQIGDLGSLLAQAPGLDRFSVQPVKFFRAASEVRPIVTGDPIVSMAARVENQSLVTIGVYIQLEDVKTGRVFLQNAVFRVVRESVEWKVPIEPILYMVPTH